MKRELYKGYIIDKDNLGRPYIYNTASPYSEDSDKINVFLSNDRRNDLCRAIIDKRIKTGQDCRHAFWDRTVKRIIVE